MSDPVVLPPGSGPRGTPANVRQPRQRLLWDVALSIVLLVLSIVGYLVGAFIALLGIAFFGSCNSGSDCSGGAVTSAAVVLLIIVVLGTIATIAALVLRFRGWWIAAVVLGTVGIGWIVSYALSAFGA